MVPDATRPGTTTGDPIAPILLFDGHCGLCNNLVDLLLRLDRVGRIRFAALQSALGQQLLQAHGLRIDDFDTAVLVLGRRALLRSSCVLRAIAFLPAPWSLAAILLGIPRPVRDGVYAWVSRHRLRIWGRRETCRMPTPAERRRFLA